MVEYFCSKCEKSFDRKDSYTKHLSRKIPCSIGVKSLAEMEEEVSELKIELKELKNIVSMSQEISSRTNEDIILGVIKRCHDIMYSEESICGKDAMHDLLRLLFLKFLEPLIEDGTVDIMDEKYYIEDPEWGTMSFGKEHLHMVKWSVFYIKSPTNEQLLKNVNFLWKYILNAFPNSKLIFENDSLYCNAITLRKLMEQINKIDINIKNISVDIFGEIYEIFINGYEKTGGKLGQFFTNRNFINIIFNLLNFENNHKTIYKFLDPCAGTGGFTIETKKHISNVELHSNEIEKSTFTYLNLNMILNGYSDLSNLKLVNSLHHVEPKEKFDLILTNPPFGQKPKYDDMLKKFEELYCVDLYNAEKSGGGDEKKIKAEVLKRFKAIFPYKANKGELLFLQLCMYKLNSGGKCAIVLPDGQLLFGKGTNQSVRKYLLDNFRLERILFNPSGTFEHTSIKTCVFFFSKPTETPLKGEPATKSVEFWKATADCKHWSILGSLTYYELKANGFNLCYEKYISQAESEKKYQDISSDFEWKTLGEICQFLPKSNRKASFGKEKGDYNFYTSSEKVKKCDELDYKEELLIIGTGGYPNIKIDNMFSCSADNIICKSINKDISNKYVYYHILNNMDLLSDKFEGVGIKHISKDSFKSICIPVPSLEKQIEIVKECDEVQVIIEHTEQEFRNIDIMIAKTNKYIVPSELKGCGWKTLGEICQFLPKSNRKASFGKEEGDYNFYTSSEKVKKCDELDYKEELLIIGDGGNANIQIDNMFSCSDHNILCKSNNESIINKYIYYYLLNNMDLLAEKFNGVGLKNISKESIKSICIPVPSLEKQERISKILEKFDECKKTLNIRIKAEKDFQKKIFNSFIA
jgi:type I restriction-modification system DNA methylase subunit